MSEEKVSLGERVQHRFVLDQVADRLGIDPSVKSALPFVGIFTKQIVERDQTWSDMPEAYEVGVEFPGIKGQLALALCRRQEGFRIFEAAMADPEQRAEMLDAYSRCWQLDHAVTELDPDQVYKAFHWHRAPDSQAELEQ